MKLYHLSILAIATSLSAPSFGYDDKNAEFVNAAKLCDGETISDMSDEELIKLSEKFTERAKIPVEISSRHTHKFYIFSNQELDASAFKNMDLGAPTDETEVLKYVANGRVCDLLEAAALSPQISEIYLGY